MNLYVIHNIVIKFMHDLFPNYTRNLDLTHKLLFIYNTNKNNQSIYVRLIKWAVNLKWL